MHENNRCVQWCYWSDISVHCCITASKFFPLLASSLFSQSLISTYSVHSPHIARRDEGQEDAEGYRPDKLLGDITASFVDNHEAHQVGHTPST